MLKKYNLLKITAVILGLAWSIGCCQTTVAQNTGESCTVQCQSYLGQHVYPIMAELHSTCRPGLLWHPPVCFQAATLLAQYNEGDNLNACITYCNEIQQDDLTRQRVEKLSQKHGTNR
jgi:hypothetical protein